MRRILKGVLSAYGSLISFISGHKDEKDDREKAKSTAEETRGRSLSGQQLVPQILKSKREERPKNALQY